MFFAAFANDKSNTLKLNEEEEAIRKIFNDQSRVELNVVGRASFRNITNIIIDETVRERIVVFHYGGHADSKNIELLDGSAESESLVGLLDKMPNLQLVVLNGCDTNEQAKTIQRAGIKAAIITTINPLNDKVAIDFADFFYHPFYKFNTLNDSFSFAKAQIIAKYGSKNNNFSDINRAIGFSNDDQTELKTGTSYILHFKNEDALNRTFLFNLEYTFLNENIAANIYRPNRLLIESLSRSILTGTYLNEALIAGGDYTSFAARFHSYEERDTNENFGKLVLAILNLLPFPLSFHLSLLESSSKNWKNLSRDKKYELLKRQIIIYNSFIQLLAYTLLSSFWNELHKGHALKVSPSEWDVLESFLNTDQSNVQDINYPILISTIRNIFKESSLQQFIGEYQELNNFFETEQEFYNSHLLMQGLKSSLANNEVSKMDIDWLCSKAEDILTAIVSKAGFVIKYKLTTIKNIEITKPRFKDPVYHIQRIFLDGATVNDDDIAGYSTYIDTRSVILAKGADEKQFTDFLNLSPFIIDENALKGENLANLCFYSHDEKDNYVYRRTENPDEKIMVQKKRDHNRLSTFEMRVNTIKEELDAFKTLVTNKKKTLANDTKR